MIKPRIPAPPSPPAAIAGVSSTVMTTDTMITISDALTKDIDARAALTEHLRIANIAAAVERYHCDIIARLGEVYDIYKKITEQII